MGKAVEENGNIEENSHRETQGNAIIIKREKKPLTKRGG